MKIGIIAQGSNGDIEISVALALGLIQRAHEVEMFVITMNDRNYSFLNNYDGLKVHQKFIDPEFRDNDMEFWSKPERGKFEIFQLLHNQIKVHLEEFSLQFAREKDLVIGPHHLFELPCAAEKYSTPYACINFHPEIIRRGDQVPFSLSHLKQRDNHRMWKMFESYFNLDYKIPVNMLREKLGLKPAENVLQEVTYSKFINLVPWSKCICQPGEEWENFVLTGFWDCDEKYNDWKPSDTLEKFLSEGDAPIFMTVGSMAEHENDLTVLQNILIRSAQLLGKRAIIHSNWRIGNVAEDNIYKLSGFISYPKVLSRCSVVVHHGGLGASHHATRAGCPSLVIKYGFDQPFNSHLLKQAGISKGSIWRKELTAQNLAVLLNESLEDLSLKKNAEEIAGRMKLESGVLEAIASIEERMTHWRFQTLKILGSAVNS